MAFDKNTLLNLYLNMFSVKIMRYHYFRIGRFVRSVASKYDFADKKILDVGAESSPYKSFFPRNSYFSHDIKQSSYTKVDYVGDINIGLRQIPDGFFDYILCTQVLEHLYDPKGSVKEMYRLLKPGGKVFLTTHMVFDEHMVPYDYFRFTKYGLMSIGEQAGFEVVHIVPHGGVFHVLAYIITYLPIKLITGRDNIFYYLYLVIFTVPIFVFNYLMYLLDYLDRKKTLTINYEVIYAKPKTITSQ